MVRLQHPFGLTSLRLSAHFTLQTMTLTCAGCFKQFSHAGYTLHGQRTKNELCRTAFMTVLAERLQDKMRVEGNTNLLCMELGQCH
jgi:hypothetical protein